MKYLPLRVGLVLLQTILDLLVLIMYIRNKRLENTVRDTIKVWEKLFIYKVGCQVKVERK